ncbi:MAG: transposase, partial [Gemmatimonadota bacterium]
FTRTCEGHPSLQASWNDDSVRRLRHCFRRSAHAWKARHGHQEFLQFLQHIDAVPAELGNRPVADSYATHKHAKFRRWLAAGPRYHAHLPPTCGSWLNQVEIWFNVIKQSVIRRGSFHSVPELIPKIQRFVDHYNANQAHPFVWTATAESILRKSDRSRQRVTETTHSFSSSASGTN